MHGTQPKLSKLKAKHTCESVHDIQVAVGGGQHGLQPLAARQDLREQDWGHHAPPRAKGKALDVVACTQKGLWWL